jgi:hypothetical protein
VGGGGWGGEGGDRYFDERNVFPCIVDPVIYRSHYRHFSVGTDHVGVLIPEPSLEEALCYGDTQFVRWPKTDAL